MIDDQEYFYKLNVVSNISQTIMQKVHASKESDWKQIIEMNLLQLSIEDFNDDPSIIEIINKFGCADRISVFKSMPNTCYGWHRDGIRNVSMNMLLEGRDSQCVFGDIKAVRDVKNIKMLTYEPNRYFLMDVSKFHTVFNFNNTRYMLSIGFPKPTTFSEARQFMLDNGF